MEMIYGLFPLPVQYAFFTVFEHSLTKPFEIEFLKGVCGEVRLKALKLASDQVSSTAPQNLSKNKSYLSKS